MFVLVFPIVLATVVVRIAAFPALLPEIVLWTSAIPFNAKQWRCRNSRVESAAMESGKGRGNCGCRDNQRTRKKEMEPRPASALLFANSHSCPRKGTPTGQHHFPTFTTCYPQVHYRDNQSSKIRNDDEILNRIREIPTAEQWLSSLFVLSGLKSRYANGGDYQLLLPTRPKGFAAVAIAIDIAVGIGIGVVSEFSCRQQISSLLTARRKYRRVWLPTTVCSHSSFISRCSFDEGMLSVQCWWFSFAYGLRAQQRRWKVCVRPILLLSQVS